MFTTNRIAVAALVSAGALAAGGAAPGSIPAATGPVDAHDDRSRVVISFSHAGLPAFMADEKDRPLAEALALFPVRWDEISREIPGMDPQIATLINTAIVALARPTRLAIVSNPDNADGGAWGYGLIASVQVEDKRDAERMDAIVRDLLAQVNLPSEPRPSDRFEGMMELQVPPVGLAAFGQREADDGWRYEFLIGSVGDPDSYFKTAPGLDGFTEVANFRIDAGGLEPLMALAPIFAQGNEEATEAIQQFQQMDLMGDDPVALDIRVGYTDNEAIAYTTIENARKLGDFMQFPRGALSMADLAVVPADAEFAWVGRGDFAFVADAIADMAESGVEVDEALAAFEEFTGVDPVADIFDSLGGTMAVYTSDTTGGGSLLSAVALISFKDRQRFVDAMNRLVEVGNNAAEEIPIPISTVSITLAQWQHDGIDLLSLRFPGLPVPLELAAAMTNDWLIVGISPQAVIAAAAQASGGGDSILNNPLFAQAFPRGKSLLSISFMSPDRLLRDGYPYVNMLCTGVANLMRSSEEPDRVPDLLMPVFHDLARGVRAQVEFSYWAGPDLVTETHSDRSAVVTASIAAGGIVRFAPAIVAAAAAIGLAAQEHRVMGEIDDGLSSLITAVLGPGGPVPLPQQVAALYVLNAWAGQEPEGDLLLPVEHGR
ncbi:MAG: hypothetical protein IH985_07790 [Planctomycetes bacterium]|nr:hypothetical protein [Planctomycetota bacterium]